MCPNCGRPYGKRRRCYYCKPGRKKTGSTTPCLTCGKPVYAEPRARAKGEGLYCSAQCKYVGLAGRTKPIEDRRSYISPAGYVMCPVPREEDSSGYRAEHRLVMERALERPLTADEHVHHINGVKDDNRIENLQVLTNADHQRQHKHPQTQARRIALVCENCRESYEVKRSKRSQSRYCSNACRLEALHENNRKTLGA